MHQALYLICACGRFFVDGFPPESQDSPPHLIQLLIYLSVAFDIALYFGNPVITVRMDLILSRFPILPVPELGIAENCHFRPLEDDVGFPRNIFAVLPIAESPRPQFLPKLHLNPRIPAFDGGHVPVALFGGMVVHTRVLAEAY